MRGKGGTTSQSEDDDGLIEETSASVMTEGVPVEETSRDTLTSINNEESVTTIEIGAEECQILLACLERKQKELMQSHPMYYLLFDNSVW